MTGKNTPLTNEEVLSRRAVYTFIQKFYSEGLNKIEKSIWNLLISSLEEDTKGLKEEKIKQGIQLLSQLKEEDLKELEYDFNRLFVGPNKLEASPYESSYLNTDNALMQRETMSVREFYKLVGLEVARKNADPDDHLALELEFVCYLLESSFDNEDFIVLYQQFLRKHLFKWITSHTELVRKKTSNKIILGISSILEGIILEEKRILE